MSVFGYVDVCGNCSGYVRVLVCTCLWQLQWVCPYSGMSETASDVSYRELTEGGEIVIADVNLGRQCEVCAEVSLGRQCVVCADVRVSNVMVGVY